MSEIEYRILAINPGSTSTKFGFFLNDVPQKIWTARHTDAELSVYAHASILAQHDYRLGLVLQELAAADIDPASFHAVVGRGGKLRPMVSGTWKVNDAMLDELRAAPRGEHASNLGAFLAQALAARAGVDAFIVDPISVNERSTIARLTGIREIERDGFCHALNSKAVAKRHAREIGQPYSALRLVVAHLGGGVCISAHKGGRMIDVTDAQEEGPFSPERAGSVPALRLVDLCFSGRYSRAEVARMLVGSGGLNAYLGTKDLIEVEKRIDAGDAEAEIVFQAMAYQIAKEIGAMATVLEGRVDAVLLTGGMAYSERLTEAVIKRVARIAPVRIYPGEEELQALTEGTLRVLRGEETALELPPLELAAE
jgi:butyrate kinase